MIRVLTILAAVAALAVSAAPVASAGPNSKTTGHSAGLAPDFGIYLSLRKAPPKPPGLGVTYFKGELVGIEPSLRKALPKPRGILSLREPEFPGNDRTPKPPPRGLGAAESASFIATKELQEMNQS